MPAELPDFVHYILLKLAIVFLVYRCLFASGAVERVFAITPLRWFGTMSYSYYLVHSLGLHAFFAALSIVAPLLEGSLTVYAVLMVPALIATIIASLPVYLLIERPLSLRPAQRAQLARHRA